MALNFWYNPEDDKHMSTFYRAARKRAKRIYKICKINEKTFKELTSGLIDWDKEFKLLPIEPIEYKYIERVCLPKCYGGKGTLFGMKLEKLVITGLTLKYE